MASLLVRSGRIAFLIFLIIQSVSLASYPATYKQNGSFYGLIILFLPALVVWLYIMFNDRNLQWLFAVWICYIVGFVIFIGIIFGGYNTIEDKLDKEKFLGPNILKMTLCLSPVILLLLLSTGTDSAVYRELIWTLSLRIAIDLFDGVEMLQVIIEENELSHEVPKGFEQAILAFVCISFLLSPLQLMEIKTNRLGDGKFQNFTAISRATIQIVFVNCVFLSLRLALFIEYGKDASIFIFKNSIIIFLGVLEMCSICTCCGCEGEG